MRTLTPLAALPLAALLLTLTASTARAQVPRVELGASLFSGAVDSEDDGLTMIGVPSAGFPLIAPGVYASFFLGQRLAIEPQIGLLVLSAGGETEHILNFVGQVDYFVRGLDESSPYVFGTAGVIDFPGSTTLKSVGMGAGYRIPAGDRLTFRVDGRFRHFLDDEGNLVAFSLSIGGLFR
jgi:hypothetical protein